LVGIHELRVLTNGLILINLDWQLVNPASRGHLDYPSDWDYSETPNKGGPEVFCTDLSSLKQEFSEPVVASTPLNEEDKSEYDNEHPVTEEAAEDIEVSNFHSTAVDHVPPLQENEGVENNSHMDGLVHSFKTDYSWNGETIAAVEAFASVLNLGASAISQVKHCFTEVNNDEHNKELPNHNSIDLSPNNLVKDYFIISDSFLMNNGSLRRFSGKREGSQQVHDNVDPEKHGRVQRRVGHENTSC